MTKQSRTRRRVQQREDGENHLISWRFSSARAGETANRFWRHNDLIEVKDRPRIAWGRFYKQQSRRRYAANGFAFIPQGRAVPPFPLTAFGRVSSWRWKLSSTRERIAPARWVDVAKK